MKSRHKIWIAVAVLLIGYIGVMLYMVDIVPPKSHTYSTMLLCKRRIQRYAIQHNSLPSSLNETARIPGYDSSLVDAWGFPIAYHVDANDIVTLTSLGRDGKPGGSGENTDMIGVFPARQPNGKWSDEFVGWSKDPWVIK